MIDKEQRRTSLESDGWVLMSDITFPAVGGFWYRREGDDHCYAIHAEPEYLNRFGWVHGGVIATLADCAMGRASRQGSHDQIQSTIDLNIHFVSGVAADEFVVARGRLVRETRTLAFLNGVVEVGDRIIADVSGIWKIHRRISNEEAGLATLSA